MSAASADQALFSYGTLQLPEVQLDTFGRLVDGEDDVLAGYTAVNIDVHDARVLELAGPVARSLLRRTGSDLDKVVGRLLWITEDELDAADEYEIAVYRRISVTLASGRTAWVYAATPGRNP